MRDRAARAGLSQSQVVREALEVYLARGDGQRSAYELARDLGLIGCVRRGARDLSTNPKHLEGFGERR